mgnify:CR=1 FL=1
MIYHYSIFAQAMKGFWRPICLHASVEKKFPDGGSLQEYLEETLKNERYEVIVPTGIYLHRIEQVDHG